MTSPSHPTPPAEREYQIDCEPTITNQQRTGVCYAHACATAIMETEKRILGRTPSKHSQLVSQIVTKFGGNGASVREVLKWLCPTKYLGYRKVFYTTKARIALDKGRVLILSFRLNDNEWKNFDQFHHKYQNMVIGKSDIYNGCSRLQK